MQGIADALATPERLDEVLLDRLLTKCSEHLSIFRSARSLLDRDYDLSPDACDIVLDVVRQNVPYVALDLPHIWTPWTKRVLLQADEVIITAAPDLANLRNAKNIVDLLKQTRHNDSRRISSQHGQHAQAARRSRSRSSRRRSTSRLSAIIEFDSETFGQAANNGQMIEETIAKAKSAAAVPRHCAWRSTGARAKVEKKSALAPSREAEDQALGDQAMFGRRTKRPGAPHAVRAQPARAAGAVPEPEPKPPAATTAAPAPRAEPVEPQRRHSEEYYDVKTTVFNALIDTIDLTQLAKLDAAAAREEIRDIVGEIIQVKNVVMSIAEQEELLEDICNDVLGYGPLEPLLARDDIADIMVNGASTTFIEVAGKVQKTGVRFADNQQLMNICQRIVSQVGRRVDEARARSATRACPTAAAST